MTIQIKRLLVAIACFLIISVIGFGILSYIRMDRTGRFGNKKWECEEYQIEFVSSMSGFPYCYSVDDGTITHDGITKDVSICVEFGDCFIILDCDEDNNVSDEDRIHASGTFTYSWLFHTLSVQIDTTDDEYSYLQSKTLVFRENK